MRFSSKILLISFALLTFEIVTYAASPQDNTFGMTDSTFAYYKKCEVRLDNPIIMTMTDTLFKMAEKDGDSRTQTVALSFKLDHYFGLENRDSIIHYKNIVQKFALENGQVKYYFFSWRRLATYYISHGLYNYAFIELNAMQKKALEMGYKEGVLDVYKSFGRIYYARKMYDLSFEEYDKAIKYALDEKIDDYNLFHSYANCAYSLNGMSRYKEALEYLDNGCKVCKRDQQLGILYKGYVDVYLNMGNNAKAQEYIDKIVNSDYLISTVNNKSIMSYIKLQKEANNNNYSKALSLLEVLYANGGITKDVYLDKKSHYLSNLGRYMEALQSQIELTTYNDSLSSENDRNQWNEQMAILDFERVKSEKENLDLQIQKSRMIFLLIGISILIIIAILLTILIIKLLNSNKKLKKSEDNLKVAVRDLESANAIKETFLHNLSHEIRTPLNAIVGFSSVIVDEVCDTYDFEEQLEAIRKNSNLLISMVNNAIDMTKVVECNEKVLSDINQCCNDAIKSISKKVQKGVRLILEPLSEPCKFLIDKKGVTQVLMNILDNSAKFTKHGSITLRIEIDKSSGQRVVITVTDTGIGIPLDMQNQVFEYFTKVNDLAQGIGLGLPLSRAIAMSMSGSLTVDSTYTNGCRIVFDFPIQ